MYQSVHFKDDALQCSKADYLKKHNIVYKAPAYKGCDGLPIGTGDFGGMVCHTEKSIQIQLNKTDVIDYGPDGNFEVWSWESEEHNTAPVSSGLLTITDEMPSFDWLYLQDYQEELSLAQAAVTCRAKTPFSGWNYRAYASHEDKVLIFEIDTDSQMPVRRKVRLEKWSSINMFHDYEQIKPLYEKNLFNVSVGEKNGTIYLKQTLQGTDYITALRLVGCRAEVCKLNDNAAEFVLESGTSAHFTVLATIVTAHDGQKADLEEAMAILDRAEREREQLWDRHVGYWRSFWDKSFISMPQEDYLENIYYLNLYQLGSSSLGSQPLTFAGLWAWFKDTRNWGHFYHWNHQQTYWGVYASNHKEFAENYLDYRFKMLENAKTDAKKLFDADDACYYSDVTNFNGYNGLEPDTVRNLTVGAQVAMDFYRYYQYTLDETFLKEKAYPIMDAAAKLYRALLEKEEDGCYRVRGGSTCYESYWNQKETITDFVTIHTLFDAILEIADQVGVEEEDRAWMLDVKAHLYPLPVTTTEFEGKTYEMLSPGRKWDEGIIATAEGTYPWAPFNLCQLSAVFPSGYIGLGKRGTREFELARNAARVLFDMDVYHKSSIGSSGHSVAAQTAARLGMREDCLPILHHFVKTYQVFPNGLTHFADVEHGEFWSPQYKSRVLDREPGPTSWELVHEKNNGNRVMLPAQQSLHFYFESISNIMTGVNEMLLQSHDGIIRVFPATPADFTALFTLCATRGFLVTAEEVRGDVRYIAIESTLGGLCSLELPWQEPIRVLHHKKPVEHRVENGIVTFPTEAGETYVITRAEWPLDNYYADTLTAGENTEPKEWEGKILGTYSLTKGRRF